MVAPAASHRRSHSTLRVGSGVVVATLLLGAPVPAAGTPVRFRLDADHSAVDFVVRHFTVARVRGTFEEVEVDLLYDSASPQESTVAVVIEADSLTTGNDERDEHLRSADFFDVDRFPSLTFTADAIRRREGRFEVSGMLSIHGANRRVVFPVEIAGPVLDPLGRLRLGVEGELLIDRRDFGLTWNRYLDNGGLFVSDEVRIEIAVELLEESPAAADDVEDEVTDGL